ncbi:unnamed protein product [Prunus armeniaca]|uniref:Uncharacterized protein n=1 Tax=Prunus armeniaca TaxID=36596 RepID=A0A6J5Y5U8_PRUAR|nr:unnamed protein product [Prunus armeniaca]
MFFRPAKLRIPIVDHGLPWPPPRKTISQVGTLVSVYAEKFHMSELGRLKRKSVVAIDIYEVGTMQLCASIGITVVVVVS